MRNTILKNPYEWINNIDKDVEDLFELDDLLYDISITIFDYRMKHNINQKELANILGVSQSMISKLESGEYNPTVEQLWKISKKLNLYFDIKFLDNSKEEKIANTWNLNNKKELSKTFNKVGEIA